MVLQLIDWNFCSWGVVMMQIESQHHLGLSLIPLMVIYCSLLCPTNLLSLPGKAFRIYSWKNKGASTNLKTKNIIRSYVRNPACNLSPKRMLAERVLKV